MKRFLFLFLFFTGVFLFFINFSQAFTLYPTKQYLTVEKGEEYSTFIEIINNSDKKEIYVPEVLSFSKDENGLPVINTQKTLIENWITPTQDSLVLESGEKGKIIFSIKIPRSIIPGSYYVGLGAASKTENESGVSFSSRLVSQLVIMAEGEVHESLTIQKWEGNKNILLSNRLKASLLLENNGDVQMPVSAVWHVLNSKSEEMNSGNFFENFIFLDHNQRLDEAEINFDSFWPGKYSIEATIDFGITKQQVINNFYVWHFPKNFLITAGVGAFWVLVLIIILVLINNHKKRHV